MFVPKLVKVRIMYFVHRSEYKVIRGCRGRDVPRAMGMILTTTRTTPPKSVKGFSMLAVHRLWLIGSAGTLPP